MLSPVTLSNSTEARFAWLLAVVSTTVIAFAYLGCSTSIEPTTAASAVAPEVEQTVRGGPPGSQTAPQWVIDHYVDRSEGVSISVHQVVIQGDLVTLLYSIELDPVKYDPMHSGDPQTRSHIEPEAHLISSNGVSISISAANTLVTDAHVALCELSFWLADDPNRDYTLSIRRLQFGELGNAPNFEIAGHWKIPIMRLNDYRTQTRKLIEYGNYTWEGRPVSDRGDVGVRLGGPQGHSSGYVGDSPRGWIATFRFGFLDRTFALVVGANGHGGQIADELYFDIDKLFESLRQQY